MPELPEVETVRRTLAPRVVGRVIERIELRLKRLLEVGSPRALARRKGSRIEALERRGKYLLLHLRPPRGRPQALVVHLGMSGQLTYRGRGQPVTDRFRRLASGYQKVVGAHSIDAHTHLVLHLDGGDRLLFRDPRTFGKLLLLPAAGLDATPRLARLGPDALDVDDGTFRARFEAARGRRVVKAVLLDQTFLAGIGNIYADEACFAARVRPQAISTRLSRTRVDRLAAGVRDALCRGLANSGTTFSDFVDGDGEPGRGLAFLEVYGRGGEPCPRCERPLVKDVVARRGTVYCPRCQRL